MKVVLFCGGQGTRIRDYSDAIPKPMIPIGYRPILWNVMKYYAHYGHTDFILCLGYKGDVIKDYFINYDETISNDFVFEKGGKEIELLNSDIEDWKITFVDTGHSSNIGMRLMKVKEHLEGEEMFLANYSDGLSNVHLPTLISELEAKPDAVGTFATYQPTGSFHVVRSDQDSGMVTAVHPISDADLWINIGYFALRKEIFDYIEFGDELVEEPFSRLISEGRLATHRFLDFWQSMDTLKDKMKLDTLLAKGNPPWEVWNQPENILPETVSS